MTESYEREVYRLVNLISFFHIITLTFFISAFFKPWWFFCDFGTGHENVRINLINVCENSTCQAHAEKTSKN